MKYFNRIKSRWLENGILHRMIRNAGYLLSSNSIVMGVSMVQSAIAARILDVAGFGLLGTITVFSTVVNKLTSFRMGELVIKFVGYYHENDDHARASAIFKLAALVEMAASLLAFLLIWLLAPLGARYFAKDPAASSWFTIYGVVILVNLVFESATGLLQLFDRFKRLAGLTIAQSFITLGLIVAAWLTDGGMMAVLAAYMAGKAMNAVGLTVAAFKEAANRWGKGWWKTPLSVIRPQIRTLVAFAISTNISASLSLINKDSELLWVSFFTSPLQAGYYKVTLALANLLQIPVAPLPQATYPELSRSVAKKNWKDMRYVLRQGSRLASIYSIAAALVLVIFGRLIIQYLYTPDFSPAYDGLIVLVAGIVIANSLYWARSALLSLGLAQYATLVNVLVTALKVIGVIILLPRIGYVGSAIMLAISHALGTSLSALKVRSEIKRQELSS